MTYHIPRTSNKRGPGHLSYVEQKKNREKYSTGDLFCGKCGALLPERQRAAYIKNPKGFTTYCRSCKLKLRRARKLGVYTGPPLQIKPALLDELLAGFRDGYSVRMCAALIGKDSKTLYSWLSQGAKHKDSRPPRRTRYSVLYDLVAKARAEGQKNLADIIRQHSAKDWKAAKYLLERRFTKDWGDPGAASRTSGVLEAANGTPEVHNHQHLHVVFDQIETPVLEFIQRHRAEFGEDPDWDIFKGQFGREPNKEEQKLLTEPKPTPQDPTSTE